MVTSNCSPNSRSMCRTSLVATIAFAAAVGCRENPTGPPADLSATLSVTNARAPYPAPTVQAAADSVVATYVSGVDGCHDYHAAAGMRSGTLVITVTARIAPDRGCAAVLASAVYRATVHGAPAGRYPVVVAMRWLQADGRSGPSSEMVRRVITLP
jgi:hypothetical protein